MISASLALSPYWKYYAKTYRALASGEYRLKHRDDVSEYYSYQHKDVKPWSPGWEFLHDEIRFSGRTIYLLGGMYLFGTIPMYFDVYSLYWYIKLRRWHNEYKDVTDIVQYKRDKKLNKILK